MRDPEQWYFKVVRMTQCQQGCIRDSWMRSKQILYRSKTMYTSTWAEVAQVSFITPYYHGHLKRNLLSHQFLLCFQAIVVFEYRSTVAHWYVICFSTGGPGFKSRQETNICYDIPTCKYYSKVG